MLEDVEALRRNILKKIHAAIPTMQPYMGHKGYNKIGKLSLEWEFLPYRLSGIVRDRTLLITKVGMTPPMLALFLEEILANTPEAELAMRHLAFDVTEADAGIRQILCERQLTRYEIGDRVFYWSEVTGQLTLF